MKNQATLLLQLITLTNRGSPQRRNQIIRHVTDASELIYTPGKKESYELGYTIEVNSMSDGFTVIKPSNQRSYKSIKF